MSIGGLGEWKGAVDSHLQLTVSVKTKKIICAHHSFIMGGNVVGKVGTGKKNRTGLSKVEWAHRFYRAGGGAIIDASASSPCYF